MTKPTTHIKISKALKKDIRRDFPDLTFEESIKTYRSIFKRAFNGKIK